MLWLYTSFLLEDINVKNLHDKKCSGSSCKLPEDKIIRQNSSRKMFFMQHFPRSLNIQMNNSDDCVWAEIIRQIIHTNSKHITDIKDKSYTQTVNI